MINTVKKTLIALISFAVIIFILQIISYAAGSYNVSVQKKEIDIGEQVTISIKVNDAAGKFTVKSSNANVKVVSQPEFADKNTVTAVVSGVSAGKSTITITAEDVTGYDDAPITGSKTVDITVKAPEKEEPDDKNIPDESKPGNTGNNDGKQNGGNAGKSTSTKSQDDFLGSLKVSVGTLSPKFSYKKLDYTVDVGADVDSIEITAKTSHAKATVSGTGTKKINPGTNVFELNVTAESGRTRTYTITVNKPEEVKEPELKLTSLTIKGVNTDREMKDLTYTPEFSEEVYNYNITVANNIEALTVEAIAKEEGTIVEVLGNENLVVGKNVVTIMIKSADESKSATYQIVVNKEEVELEAAPVSTSVEIPEDISKSDRWMLIAISGGIALLAIVGIAIAIVLYRKNKVSSDDSKEFGQIESFVEEDKKSKGKHF